MSMVADAAECEFDDRRAEQLRARRVAFGFGHPGETERRLRLVVDRGATVAAKLEDANGWLRGTEGDGEGTTCQPADGTLNGRAARVRLWLAARWASASRG